MPDESPEATAPDVNALRVVIETRGVNVTLDGPGATEERAYALWQRVFAYQVSKGRVELEANAMGFQIEQSNEWRNDNLPGGAAS